MSKKVNLENIYTAILKDNQNRINDILYSQKKSFYNISKFYQIDNVRLDLNKGAYYSLCLKNNKSNEFDAIFFVAVALSRYIKEKYNLDIKFNWFNELYYQNKKIGELSTIRNKKWLVISIAINLNEEHQGSLNLDLDNEKFVQESIKYITLALKENKERIYEEYQNKMILLNKEINLENNQIGIVRGLDLSNSLIVELK